MSTDPLARLFAYVPPDAARDAAIRIEDLLRNKRAGMVLRIEVDEQGHVNATVERRYSLTKVTP